MSAMSLVLVVEDNQVMRYIATATLKRHARVEIHVAENGMEAVELAKANHYQLILMDVHMPKMDGLMATKTIRQLDDERGVRTPIVAVTASDTSEHCFAAGMDDYVHKPADFQRILKKWIPQSLRKYN